MLKQLYDALVSDVAEVLALDAGTREAAQSGHMTRLVDDVRRSISIDGGLAALLGPAAPTPTNVASATSWSDHVAAELNSLDAATRISVRGECISLHDMLGLARRLFKLQKHLGGPAFRVRLDPQRPRRGGRPKRWETGPLFNLDRQLGDLANARCTTRMVAAAHRDLASKLEGCLETAQALAHELRLGARSRHREALAEFQVTITRAFNHAHRLAAVVAADLLTKLGKEAGPQIEPAGDLSALMRIVEQVSNDFVGADLRLAVLGSVHLNDVRWSDSTRWPGEWRQHALAASVEIEPGVYRVNSWGERAHNTTVGM